jgi:hypothetical protein
VLLGGCRRRVAEPAVALVVAQVRRLDRVAVERGGKGARGYPLDLCQ